MCDAVLVGTAASAFTATAPIGAAAAVSIPATAGLFGSAGAFTFAGLAPFASAGLSLFGSGQQVAGQQAFFNYQTAVASNNAIIARRAADRTIAERKAQDTKDAFRQRQFAGLQKNAQAGLGQDVGSGSAVDLRADAAAFLTLSRLELDNAAEFEALNFLTQAGSFDAEARLNKLQRSAAGTAGTIAGVQTLVGLASRVSRRNQRVPTLTGGFA